MEQLLTTKLYIPPARPVLVPRPRLIERLNQDLRQTQGFGRKLTLISAPAGFGKTTLVAEWVSSFRLKVESGLNDQQDSAFNSQPVLAWLSLDEGDNDIARFLAYVIAALNQIEAFEGTLGERALTMLQSPQPPAEAILTSLINEIAAMPVSIIFVLDDYHSIESTPVDAALTFTLERLPPQMHLVIATRNDPLLPLARLRAQGQLNELRAADLRFTLCEAAEFLNQVMGLELSAEDIAALEKRTEGWIAGLQLAAISMQGHKDTASLIKSFTGSHRFVLDYLVQEVLEQQPESIQTFLLQTAILNRLSGPLCDAVRFGTPEAPTGEENGQATLERLERANLFVVPLDNERRWYRYHRLFADLLRRRLRQTHPDWVPRLHQRASEWYGRNGFADQAIEHALRAEDFERAADLIVDHFDVTYQRGEHTKLRDWLAEFPVEWMCSNPHLCVLQAWNLFTSGKLDEADQRLQCLNEILDRGTDQAPGSLQEQERRSGDDRLKLVGRAATVRAYLASYSGDNPGTIQYADQALDNLPAGDYLWRSAALIALGDAFANQGKTDAAYEARADTLVTSKAAGDIYLLLMANMRFAETLRQQGKLQQVTSLCKQQMQYAQESGLSKTVVAGWLLAIWGEALAEINELDEAILRAKNGAELTERGRDVAMIGWSNLCLVRVLFSTGDMTGAEEIIRKIELIDRYHDMPLWVPVQMSAWQARIWLAQDKLEAASRWVREGGLDLHEAPTYLHEMEYIVLARLFIAQGRLAEAAGLLRRLLVNAEDGGRISRVIEILMLQALAFQAGGDPTQAMATLQRALTVAEPGGFIRIFVDEGPPMACLLYEALDRGIAPNYVRPLLAAFPIAEAGQTDPSMTKAIGTELVEPLSEREIQVLQLIARGLTNQEIAARLYLSLNTVKVHSRNIYGKLNVHNRTQAISRSQALGLLTPW